MVCRLQSGRFVLLLLLLLLLLSTHRQNPVGGHNTGSNNSGVEEHPKKTYSKHEKPADSKRYRTATGNKK